MTILTPAEKLFCQICAETNDIRAAVAKSGVAESDGSNLPPESIASSLLDRVEVRREIARWEKLHRARQAQLQAGIRRLAFGSVTDAVRLLLTDEPPSAEELERMDLFNVSEIKRPKNGGLEIRFYDRLKALELLAAHSGEENDALGGFLKALKS